MSQYISHNIAHGVECQLLFGVTVCVCVYITWISIFTNKCQIGCLDTKLKISIIECGNLVKVILTSIMSPKDLINIVCLSMTLFTKVMVALGMKVSALGVRVPTHQHSLNTSPWHLSLNTSALGIVHRQACGTNQSQAHTNFLDIYGT